jgi:hypothetical protein
MSQPTYRELIDAGWMSGRLVVTKHDLDVMLTKNYYPLAVAVWCFLVIGGLGYFLHGRADSIYFICFLGVGILISAVIIGFAISFSRRPPILIARYGGAIEIPRYNLRFNVAEVLSICFRPVSYHRPKTVPTKTYGGCLYARITHSPDPIPLYVDDIRADVRRIAEQLAGALGVKYEMLEKQDIV